ncbi:heme utilization protein [Kineococcus sp. DHX-1]|uniref:heme utilization protein n=1 Tax=Kineococcus sp. DHX-1 TaxID=3349638 RepID=UPI0036D28360
MTGNVPQRQSPLGPERPREAGDPFRYGVYLRPDPATCLAVTTVTAQVRAQYGFVSAGAFPPHATLVGSQHVGRDEAALERALDEALRDRPGFAVHNAGVRPLGIGYVYDVHHRQDGSVNADLLDLASAVDAAVAPLRVPMANPKENVFDPASFNAHLSLVSHDLYERPDLAAEVGAYVGELPVSFSREFRGDTVTLYRTTSEDWTGRWWRTLQWEHLRTWRLG